MSKFEKFRAREEDALLQINKMVDNLPFMLVVLGENGETMVCSDINAKGVTMLIKFLHNSIVENGDKPEKMTIKKP